MEPVDINIRPIGGFFGLGLAEVPPTPGSIWQRWTGQGRLALAAWTGRAALRMLIAAKRPGRVWLPGYICREIAAIAPAAALRFYPLDEELSPQVVFLRQRVRTGDLVLAVDYFGWPPAEDFIDLAGERDDIVWVEDRSQCLWTERDPWADWMLYTPRKLVGVADGGLLIARGEAAVPDIGGALEGRAEALLALPELLRFEDASETNNAEWYAAFKASEAGFSAEPRPLSRLTAALLQRIPLAPLVEARRRNFAFLAARLKDYRAWDRAADAIAPFGLPIAVADAEGLGAALAKERLFCSRHWPPAGLAVDAAEFPAAHRLARRLLTLPCDHRYDERSLARLVEAVERLAPGPGRQA